MSNFRRWSILHVALLICIGSGCDSSTPGEIGQIQLPSPISPLQFDAAVRDFNPFFPLEVGVATTFIGQTAGGEEVILVEVTDRKKLVQGITTTVVRDRVWLDGVLIEDTDDWFAQDKEGNVWYLGEDVKNYKDGVLVDRNGSWEAGVDGALAGVVMWARPEVGSIYYQEYYKGQAEDVGKVLSISDTVNVPFGALSGCVKTEDTTPLEPDVLEYKYFCPGVGHALTVDVTEGGTRFELISVGDMD